MSITDIYTLMLGVSAVISALNSGRNSKALQAAINELRATLQNHEARIERLEDPDRVVN